MLFRTVLKCRRQCAAAVRSVSPLAAVALTLVVVFGGVGIAGAATGGNFILGRANSERSEAVLSSSRGTPLSLKAPRNAAPLAVNRKVLVSNLNAQYLGGLSASQLQTTGGDGITFPGQVTGISSPTKVVSTGPLVAGIYYVTATARVGVTTGDSGGQCYIAPGSNPTDELQVGGGTQTGSTSTWIQAAETVAVSVSAGDTLQEWCSITGPNASIADNAAITAIRILSSSGTRPATATRPAGPARASHGRG